jgi:hypothetical protein
MAPPKRSKPAEDVPEKLPHLLWLVEDWSKGLGTRRDLFGLMEVATGEDWKIEERHDFQTPVKERYDKVRRPYTDARETLERLSKIGEQGVKGLSGLSPDELRKFVELLKPLSDQILKIIYKDSEEEAGVLSAYAKVYKLSKELEGVVLEVREKTGQMTRKAFKKDLKATLDEGGIEMARRASQKFELFIDNTDPVLELLETGKSLQELDKGSKLMLLRHLIDGPNPFKICGEDEMEKIRMFALRLCEKLKFETGPFRQVLKPYLESFVGSLG